MPDSRPIKPQGVPYTHEIRIEGYYAHCVGIHGQLVLGTWGSYGMERLHLSLDSAWDDLVITAYFRLDDAAGATAVVMEPDGIITVPAEATMAAGGGSIVIEGVEDGRRIYSVNIRYMALERLDTDGTQPPPTPSQWEQFVAQVEGFSRQARQSADSAAASEKNAEAAAAAAAETDAPAAGSRQAASAGADSAAKSAALAQQGAANAGWFDVYGEGGILYMARSDNAPEDFRLADNGHGILEAIYG